MTTMWLIRCSRSLPAPLPFDAAAAPLTNAAMATAAANASTRERPSRCESFVILSPCCRRPVRGHDIALFGRPEEPSQPLGSRAVAEPVVHVGALTKVFKVPEREAGLRAATKALVRRRTRDVQAVDAISFDIPAGEIVGFLGPNGAGKTTTLKMLSGLLYPTGGEARVLGHVPSRRERDYLRRMTMVMGNRNQLQWDIPALDSFELNRAIYRLQREDYLAMRDELVELLDVGDLVRKPVRNLSLGERMKVEIVGALLHRPQVLFLDEPTIGLDVTMQKRIRTFVAEYNHRHEATVLLTSHYMADVE